MNWLKFATLILLVLTFVKVEAQAPSHDPTEMVYEDGRYYIYTTGGGVFGMSSDSPDFKDWRAESSVFSPGNWPAWINDYVNDFGGMFWAPGIIYMNNKWHIYYSCSSFGSQYSAIGLATTNSLGSGEWEDQGMVTFSDQTWPVNAIDADIFKDNDGKVWLLYGSYWSGIVMTELDSITGMPIDRTKIISVANNGCEAGHLAENDGYYYLFFNRGACCEGINSTYQIFMGRSENSTGPFLDKNGRACQEGGGTSFMHSDGKFVGPGHFGLLDSILTYHYYDANRNGAPLLGVAEIEWIDGWPVAKYTPNVVVGEDPVVMFNKNSAKIIELQSGETDDGTNVTLATEKGLETQQWVFTYLDNNYYRISPVSAPDKALEIQGGSTGRGANVQISTYTSDDHQQWYIAKMGSFYRVMNKKSHLALEIKNAYSNDGANVQQWNFNEHDCQQWRFRTPKVVGVTENTLKTTFDIYPNPVTDKFFVRINESAMVNASLGIYQLDGKLIYSNNSLINNNIEITKNFDKGIYLVVLKTNGVMQTQKLLVE